jgi:hypothetical protein
MHMEWESDLYDFSDPEVRLKYVPELGCSVGGAISMLRKSWKSYKTARREGYEDRRLELEYRINSIQDCRYYNLLRTYRFDIVCQVL